ncbi:MAG: hypothetical protein KKG75_02770 [Nanoarchaeota archaeon]|nr:hypothetical protein [Nanoarchaeota archaeon]
MKFDEDLAAIHGYLCADGYVSSPKKKYHRVSFTNTDINLIEDFKKRFESIFGIEKKISITKGRKNWKDRYNYISDNKEIHFELCKFGSYYAREWSMPFNLTKKEISLWLRAFFDSEGWLECEIGQNRRIGAESINHKGLNQIQNKLKEIFKIDSIIKIKKKGKISRLEIFGKNNIIKFSKNIGFIHTNKKKMLKKVILSYPIYEWKFPKNKEKLKEFIKKIVKKKAKIKQIKGKPTYVRLNSIIEKNFKKLSKLLYNKYKIKSKIYKCINGYGTVYYELDIQDINSIQKLIKNNLIKKSIVKELTLANPNWF